MVVLYLVTGCVLFYLGSAEDVVYDEGYSRLSYPNPKYGYSACGRTEQSYICDPNTIISESEADQLNKHLVDTVSQSPCPCSRYSCVNHNNEGYKIGIALTSKIIPGEAFDESGGQELAEDEWEAKRREWLLHEAELFAHELLTRWQLGHCEEAVIVLYSLHDGVLYTAVGDVARKKLNSSVVEDVSYHARLQFGRGGSIFKGLLKMIKDYRRVFQDNYEMGKPRAEESRNYAASVTAHCGSVTVALMLVMSIFSMVL